MRVTSASRPIDSPRRVLYTSAVGTTIELFGFYIYATAAVLIFPSLFFPADDPLVARLQSFATFALAFFARPLGAVVFGHFGDRIGRKTTVIAALLTTGISTTLIGLLPTYEQIGVAAPVLLALCRFGQGIGLGGGLGGTVLLAVENAPTGWRARYGMFPQLGSPFAFILATATFLLLTQQLRPGDFNTWGWRLPFLGSALLVFVGLYMRLRLQETPSFQRVLAAGKPTRVPLFALWHEYRWLLMLATVAIIGVYVLFYLMTVFTLSWVVSNGAYTREAFLQLQMFGAVVFGLMVVVSTIIADHIGCRRVLLAAMGMSAAFGFTFELWFGSQTQQVTATGVCLGFALMGAFGPLGAALSNLFPAKLRYSGASIAYHGAGILGASAVPYIAVSLATNHGVTYVGYYLSIAAALSLIALLAISAARFEQHKAAGE